MDVVVALAAVEVVVEVAAGGFGGRGGSRGGGRGGGKFLIPSLAHDTYGARFSSSWYINNNAMVAIRCW